MTVTWKVTGVFARGVAILLGCAVYPTSAQTPPAQSPSNEWQFTAFLYGYFPQLGGKAVFPTGQSVNITVDADKLIDNLKFAAMGSFAAQRGPTGVFVDLVYADVSGGKSGTKSFSVDSVPTPSDVTANLTLHVRSTVWTFGASYRVVASPEATFDVLLGGRELVLKQSLDYQFSGNIGPILGPGLQGTVGSDNTNWNAVIGAKGRFAFGDHHQWFVPYYLDVGTGGANLTWQALGGLGYRFNSWGDVVLLWRYIDWNFSKDSTSFSMNGPALGVAFHW
jgi:hypothetical protein